MPVSEVSREQEYVTGMYERVDKLREEVSARGRGDLYVAMTRATQRLGVLHTDQPPAELAALLARRPR